MPLDIRPTVDFAFKMLFGVPEHSDLLISILNAVLQPTTPIAEVEILNPFNPKKTPTDKLSVVDVKARDEVGNRYIIEMQTSIPVGLKQRLIYYTAGLYFDQLSEGQGYGDLCPAISICFLTQTLFLQTAGGHSRFMLFDSDNDLLLTDHMQLHFVELPKYNLEEAALGRAADFERWVFFLDRAADYEADSLVHLLPEPAFHKATGVLEMIARSPNLRTLYDDEAKAELDRFSALKGAREEGEAIGRTEGRADGLQQGTWIGKIAVLEQLLGLPETDTTALARRSLAELQQTVQDLQQRLSER